jgi:ketosteroid isomerase-like protein
MKLRSLFLALAIAGLFAAPAVAAGPPKAIMTTIDGLAAATNSQNTARVSSYFASSATVIDEFPPFIWSGSGAGASWWDAVKKGNAKAHWTHLHVSVGTITQYTVAGDMAYVVVPLDISWMMGAKRVHETGLWMMTLARSASAWKVTTASWARQTGPA